MKKLLLLVEHLWPGVTDEFKKALQDALVREERQKKSSILQEGQIAHRIYFVEEGYLRGYYLKNGEDLSTWFMKKDDFVISIISFYTQTPSEEHIETLEDCILWSISYDSLHELYQQFPEFNLVGRVLTEKYYVLSEQRTQNLRKKTTTERYLHLVSTFPDISDHVSLKHIASYLGITSETLSRLRGKKWKNRTI